MARHDEFNEDEWTPEESALLESLPRERVPSAELKARTTDAVRRHVRAAPIGHHSSRRALMMAAAACLIFIAGAVVGFAAARRAARPSTEPPVASTGHAVARSNAPVLILQPTRHVVWY